MTETVTLIWISLFTCITATDLLLIWGVLQLRRQLLASWDRENRVYALLAPTQKLHWNAAVEQAALIVDQANLDGPYQAIGAASEIRRLKRTIK